MAEVRKNGGLVASSWWDIMNLIKYELKYIKERYKTPRRVH